MSPAAIQVTDAMIQDLVTIIDDVCRPPIAQPKPRGRGEGGGAGALLLVGGILGGLLIGMAVARR